MASSCTDFTSSPPTNTQDGGAERWVEVRVCYQFTGILALPPLPTEIWLQRNRNFVIPCYFGTGTANPCG